MSARKLEHWNHLAGMEIEVKLGPTSTVTGTVDQVMPDSSILWLTPAGDQRRIIEKSRGHEVWVRSDTRRTGY